MYAELYDDIIQKASKRFNLNPQILKHVETRFIINALLLPNNYNVELLKSKYDEVAKKFGAWRNFDHCVSDMKRRQGYSDDIAKKVCGKLKHELEKSTPQDVKRQIDETTEQITTDLINKLNEKLQDAFKQWEMVLKEKSETKSDKNRNKKSGSDGIYNPAFAEKFMTEVRLVTKPMCTCPPPDGIVKTSATVKNVTNQQPSATNGHQLQQLHQQVSEQLGKQIGEQVITKDHQGADSYHVTLYFATPEPKSETEIRNFVESVGAIVLDYQPASGYWLDPAKNLVGDEYVHVVTVDIKPEQLVELDKKIKSEFKQSSVLITAESDIGGYSGGKILRYEVPKSEDEIRKLLIDLSEKHGGATYLRGKTPSIITIAQLQADEKPEIYYTFT
jgi:hypothetical protein